MIPSNTLLTMKNLPFFAIFRSYTAYELHRLTHGPKVDPAWQHASGELTFEMGRLKYRPAFRNDMAASMVA